MHSSLNMLAFGLPLGAVVAIILNQVMRGLIPTTWIWVAGLATVIFVHFIYVQVSSMAPEPTRKFLELQKFKIFFVWIASLLPAYFYLLFLWSRWPLTADGWWGLNTDAPTYEGIAISSASFGPTTDLSADGYGISYFWLSNAWSGQLTDAVGALPYFATTRILSVWSLFVVALVAWSVGTRFSKNMLIPSMATVLGTAGTLIPSRLNHSFPTLFDYSGPSVQFSLAMVTIIVLLMITLFSKRVNLGLCIVLILLIGAAGSARITILWNIGSALTVTTLYLTARKRISLKDGISIGFCLATGIAISIFTVFLLPQPGVGSSPSEALTWLAPSLGITELHSLVPIWGPVGSLLFIPSFIAMICISVSGALWLIIYKRALIPTGLGFLLLANLAAGIYGAFSMGNLYSTQIASLYAGVLPMLMLSGVALGTILEMKLKPLKMYKSKFFLVSGHVALGLLFGVSLLILWQTLYGFRFDAILRWGIPIGLFTLLVLSFSVKRRRPRSIGINMVITLTIATATTSVAAVAWYCIQPQTPVDRNKTYAINNDMIEAGRWVQENTNRNVVLATNRFCAFPTDTPPDCWAPAQSITVFAHRQALLEGFEFLTASLIPSDIKMARINNSFEFATDANSENCKYLQGNDVDYFWLDKSTYYSPAAFELGTLVYDNDTISILKLDDCIAGDS